MGRGGTPRRNRIGLVGFVKSKGSQPAPAQVLYTSPLFARRRRWVGQTCERWFILSAKYGLLVPERVLAPYDRTLTEMPVAKRRAWSNEVLRELRSRLPDLSAYTFEFHAGFAYLEFQLREGLLREGAADEVSCQHLPLGR